MTCTEHRVKFDQKEARHKERVSLNFLLLQALSEGIFADALAIQANKI